MFGEYGLDGHYCDICGEPPWESQGGAASLEYNRVLIQGDVKLVGNIPPWYEPTILPT